jgi:site-specific DNA recombinase
MRVAYGNTNPDTGEKAYYYTCSMKNASGGSRCKNTNVRGDLIEKVVMEKLKEATADTGLLLKDLQEYKQEAAATNDIQALITDINKKIQGNESSIQNLVKQLSENQNTAASKYIISEIERLSNEIEEYEEQLRDYDKQNSEAVVIEKSIDMLIELLKKFNNIKDDCTIEEKQLLLGNIVDAVYWDGQTGNVEIAFWGDKKK